MAVAAVGQAADRAVAALRRPDSGGRWLGRGPGQRDRMEHHPAVHRAAHVVPPRRHHGQAVNRVALVRFFERLVVGERRAYRQREASEGPVCARVERDEPNRRPGSRINCSCSYPLSSRTRNPRGRPRRTPSDRTGHHRGSPVERRPASPSAPTLATVDPRNCRRVGRASSSDAHSSPSSDRRCSYSSSEISPRA